MELTQSGFYTLCMQILTIIFLIYFLCEDLTKYKDKLEFKSWNRSLHVYFLGEKISFPFPFWGIPTIESRKMGWEFFYILQISICFNLQWLQAILLLGYDIYSVQFVNCFASKIRTFFCYKSSWCFRINWNSCYFSIWSGKVFALNLLYFKIEFS